MRGEELFRVTFALTWASFIGAVYGSPNTPAAILILGVMCFILFIVAALEIWRE